MTLDSDSSIDASGCTVQVNSSDPTALEANSNSAITAESICVAGDYDHSGTGTYSPAPDTGCAPMLDPLAAVSPPAFSGCDHNNTYLDDAIVTLSPGVYCGGLHIDGNSIVNLDPGVFVIKDADFHLDSNSSVEGDGVGFYLTNSATLHFDSNTQVDLSAPTSGEMAGLLIAALLEVATRLAKSIAIKGPVQTAALAIRMAEDTDQAIARATRQPSLPGMLIRFLTGSGFQ